MIALGIVAGTAAVLCLGTASADPLRSTSTSVTCQQTVIVFQSDACTASVAVTDSGSGTIPTGTVEFFATTGGTSAQRATCTLAAGSCQVTFRGWGSSGLRTVTATYEGDAGHAGSSGTQKVVVTAPIGPGPCCFVPRVKGERLVDAKRAIRRYGFSIGRIERAFSRHVHRGRVISERPGQGKLVARDAKVDLVVSKGKRHARP